MKLFSNPHRFSKKQIVFSLVLIVTFMVILTAFDPRFTVRRYTVDSPDISSKIKIVLVTDLHSCYYGKGQNKLITAIRQLSPDLVLLGGDIFDDDLPPTNTDLFLEGISKLYPCYYVTGNHEYWSGEDEFASQMATLKKHGVTILSNTCKTILINGETINLCGVEDPESYQNTTDKRSAFMASLQQVKAAANSNQYTILLSHRPEYFAEYVDLGFDLVLCGHAHGGQWRIPFLLNGLYAPDQGLFPDYAGGMYNKHQTSMIVSRGLTRESTQLPRIFNRPELVFIEIE